jgi:hypothetical protein
MVRRSTSTANEIKSPRIGLPYIGAGFKTEIVRIVIVAVLKVRRSTSSSNRPDKKPPRIGAGLKTEIVRIVNVAVLTVGMSPSSSNRRDKKPPGLTLRSCCGDISRTITEIVRIVNVCIVTVGQEEYKHNRRD